MGKYFKFSKSKLLQYDKSNFYILVVYYKNFPVIWLLWYIFKFYNSGKLYKLSSFIIWLFYKFNSYKYSSFGIYVIILFFGKINIFKSEFCNFFITKLSIKMSWDTWIYVI